MAKKSLTLNTLAGFLVTLSFAGLSLYSISWMERLESALYGGLITRTATERQADQRLVLIEIDEKSIERLGAWPWPRDTIAQMIDLLRASGPKIIGVSLPFYDREANQGLAEVKSFKDRFKTFSFSRKDSMVTEWVQDSLREMEKKVDGDGNLVAAVAEAGNVILPAFSDLPSDQRDVPGSRDIVSAENFLNEKEFPHGLRKALEVTHLYLPFRELAQAASGFGHRVDSFSASEKVIAHSPVVSYRGSLFPSFALRIAAAYAGLPPGRLIAEGDRIRMGDHDIPLWQGQLLLKFYKKGDQFPRYSFADLLQMEKPPSFQGKIALLGFNLKGRAMVQTPLSGPLSENQLNACVLDNLLNRNFTYRPGHMGDLEVAILLLFGAAASYFFPRMGEWTRLVGVVGFAGLAIGVEGFILAQYNLWVKAASLAGAVILIYWITTLWQQFATLGVERDSAETDKLLALSLQSQGLLDLAFEKFRKLPRNAETKDLIYGLGVEYEQKLLFKKAIAAYEFIKQEGPFRDLDVRIPRLQEADRSSSLESHGKLSPTTNVLNATPLEEIKKIGRYEILQVMGKGSMGLVYKALDPNINRLLAIKTIRFSDEFDEDVIQEIKERFFREAEIAGQLSHPSIVTIHDLGEDQDLTYMAMEFLEGEDLENFVSKKSLLPLKKVLGVLTKVAEALDFAHRAGVIHRDIKPANIRLLKSGGVKVTDFGIARAISSSRTRTGVILGTPNYMSPEQIMGQKIDPRSDIFSLGVLLYQLLTGELPFQGDSLSSLLYQITQIKHPPLKAFSPKIPVACEQIVDKALAKNPNDRFSTAGQVAKVLGLLTFKIEQRQRRQSPEKARVFRTS
jgi:CHASE2 domain-containing sensor protein/tRNA A-37 threonylcarbamoyl transferase component Bud32